MIRSGPWKTRDRAEIDLNKLPPDLAAVCHVSEAFDLYL
jgi:hypothetical protein